MSVVKYCGLALLSLSVVLIVSQFKRELGRVIGICLGAAFLVPAFAQLFPTIEVINEFVADTPLAKYSSTLLKALGVALAVEICSDMCRDAGEPTLASRLEMIGKAELLLLALPLVSELIGIAKGFL